jgi:2-keto-3-deoxy-L-rhamnonate aldolase RhmA
MESAIAAFRSKLDAGRVCIGPSITFSDPLVTDALASSVDFFWIDTEHSALAAETVGRHLLATRARRVPALVRVPGSAVPFIKPVLDVGADGVIVPQVRSLDEVRAVVDACRYPPLGHRGFGPRVPSNYGRDSGPAYLARANRELFVAVQIETVEALDQVEAIAAVPGLDSLALGPWDLSGALGHLGDVEHPVVVAAIERVIAAARAAGIYVGSGMGADPIYAATMARRGCQWLQVGDDYDYLVSAMDTLTADIRARLAH